MIGRVDGGWAQWSDWSPCSVACGGGTQTQTRTCSDPAPANGGQQCEGEDVKTRECNTNCSEGNN